MKSRKKRIGILFCIFIMALMIPFSVFGSNQDNQSAKGEQTVSFQLNKGEAYDKSIHMQVFTSILNKGNFNGNIVTFSNTITNNGQINGNIVSISPNFTNSGIIEKNLIGYYNNIYLNNGKVNKDIIVYGDKFISNEKTEIKGDVNLFVDDVILKGKSSSDVYIVGDSVTINADIRGDVEVVCNELVLGRETKIDGSLTYQCTNPIVKTQESKVTGGIKQKDLGVVAPMSSGESDTNLLDTFLGYYDSINKISILIIAIIFIKLFPISALKIELFTRRNILKCMSVGAITMFGIIPCLFILILSVIGLPTALHLMALYFNLTYIATIPTALVLGGLFVKGQNLNTKVLTGIFILLILEFLPFTFINNIIVWMFNLIGIGSVVMLVSLYLKFQMKREKTEYITLMSLNDSREDIIKTKQKFEQMKRRKFEEALRAEEERVRKEKEDLEENNNETDNIESQIEENKKEDNKDE